MKRRKRKSWRCGETNSNSKRIARCLLRRPRCTNLESWRLHSKSLLSSTRIKTQLSRASWLRRSSHALALHQPSRWCLMSHGLIQLRCLRTKSDQALAQLCRSPSTSACPKKTHLALSSTYNKTSSRVQPQLAWSVAAASPVTKT